MGSYTQDELQNLNMAALKALPESDGGRSLNKAPLIDYILNDEAAKAAIAADEEALGPGPHMGDAGTVTFALPDEAQRRTVVMLIDGERHNAEFHDGIYTTDDQEEVDALYKAGYNPMTEAQDARPPKPTL